MIKSIRERSERRKIWNLNENSRLTMIDFAVSMLQFSFYDEKVGIVGLFLIKVGKSRDKKKK